LPTFPTLRVAPKRAMCADNMARSTPHDPTAALKDAFEALTVAKNENDSLRAELAAAREEIAASKQLAAEGLAARAKHERKHPDFRTFHFVRPDGARLSASDTTEAKARAKCGAGPEYAFKGCTG
jgi:hypothetical protein